jgi:hypothetical protein
MVLSELSAQVEIRSTESLVETSRQESLRPSLLIGVLGTAHGRPEAVRKDASRTRAFNQGAAEAAGSVEGVKFENINRSCIQVG